MRTSCLAVALAILAPLSAAAQPFVSVDDPVFGPDSVTLDEATGLEFLDLNQTRNVSTATIAANLGPGQLYDGWRFPTLSVVFGVVNAFSGTAIDTNSPSASVPFSVAQSAIEQFGVTESVSFGFEQRFSIGRVQAAPGSGEVVVGWATTVLPTISPFASVDALFEPSPFGVYGVWLVREFETSRPTYQGRLVNNGEPHNEPVDLRFSLVDPAGIVVAGPNELPGVNVEQGLFSVPLPFSNEDLGTRGLSLRIGVRTPAGSAEPFVTLSPDQLITPVPRSLVAVDAKRADSATTADTATRADSATTADTATRADSATDADFALVAVDATALSNTSTVAIPLNAPWEVYGVDYAPPRATLQGVLVTLSGLVREPTVLNQNGFIGTLPVGFRPAQQLIYNLRSDKGSRRVDIDQFGNVILRNDLGQPAIAWISLSGVSFPLN